MPEIPLSFADADAFRRELDGNLVQGRTFARGQHAVAAMETVTVQLVREDIGVTLALEAVAVMVTPGGVGLELRPFDDEVVARMRALSEEDQAPDPVPEDTGASGGRPPSRQEEIRRLAAPQRRQLARSGELPDRVLLERAFGKDVWEALLTNPRLTIPEVARIARKGSLPRPLVDLIVDNAAWAKNAVVRRALLGNPRLSLDSMTKLLQSTPRHELNQIARGTAYSPKVRQAAKRLMK
jgi:hypothetical protein